MEGNSLYLKSCGCFSLKTGVTITAVITLVASVLNYVGTLAIIIIVVHAFSPESLNFYSISSLLFFDYSVTQSIVFTCFLLYGAIRDIPKKSGFIFAWLLFKATYICMIIWAHIAKCLSTSRQDELIKDTLLLLGVQILPCYIVYSYYRTLPKQWIDYNY